MDALIVIKYKGLTKNLRCQDCVLKTCLVVLGKVKECEVLSVLGIEAEIKIDLRIKDTDLRGLKLYWYLFDSLKKAHFHVDHKSYTINNLNSLLKRGQKLKEIPKDSYRVRWEKGALRRYVEIYSRPKYNLSR